MKYEERVEDLFKVDREEYNLVQCISADCAMGAGIAWEFRKHFPNMRKILLENNTLPLEWPGIQSYYDPSGHTVINLVTKERGHYKPTLASLKAALIKLRDDFVVAYEVEKLAMPKIGCGLDRLKWEDVSAAIKEIFANVDVEILVCCLPEKIKEETAETQLNEVLASVPKEVDASVRNTRIVIDPVPQNGKYHWKYLYLNNAVSAIGWCKGAEGYAGTPEEAARHGLEAREAAHQRSLNILNRALKDLTDE